MAEYTSGMNLSERATQAWTILMGKAANRQTMTYGELDKLMKYGSPQLGGVLSRIKNYCEAKNLPRLNYLVVGKGSGEPGGHEETSSEEREQIITFDWYSLIPPSAEDFDRAAGK